MKAKPDTKSVTFGILSFCAAGLLAFHVVPMMHQLVIPYWFQGQSSGGYIQFGFGPLQLSEPQMCVFEAVLALLVIALIVAGIHAFKSRDKAA